MSASLPGGRELPASRYDLGTYWGRVRQAADISDPRTLLTSPVALEHAKAIVTSYKTGQAKSMNPELWGAKKIVDSTLHPDTGQPVLLPFRMSCFVLSNLIVTAGMLTPGMGAIGTVTWQIVNQSLNVAINTANANKSSPLSTTKLVQSYLLAVSASCSVALGLNALVPRLKRLSPSAKLVATRLVPFAAVASAGALNVFLMRGEEMRTGIDVFPAVDQTAVPSGSKAVGSDTSGSSSAAVVAEHASASQVAPLSDPQQTLSQKESLGRSKKAATLAVAETALSRVLNATPVMAIPPLVLVRLQRTEWLRHRPRMVLPVNLGLIFTTSIFALPLALAVFPTRQRVRADKLEAEFGRWEEVEFNRGI